MKFYSEVTSRLYNSEKELVAAETEVKKAEAAEKAKKENRSKRAKEVEEAIKNANEAQSRATKLLRDFTRDYGYFHMSYSTEDAQKADEKQERINNTLSSFNFFDLLDSFLN